MSDIFTASVVPIRAPIKWQFGATPGIPLLSSKAATAEAADILIIDSVSHFWTELMESYQREKKRKFIQFEDWNYLKREWRKFSDSFVSSKLHIVLCGRAGWEYDYEVKALLEPNDPLYPQLWGLNNIGQTGGIPGADIDAPLAWNYSTGSSSRLVHPLRECGRGRTTGCGPRA